jgi:hypothetical protein
MKDICCLCGKKDTVNVEVTSYEMVNAVTTYTFCRQCWDTYFRPGFAVVFDLVKEKSVRNVV